MASSPSPTTLPSAQYTLSDLRSIVTCLPFDHTRGGIWLGDNPLKFSTPLFMAQLAISVFFTGTMDFFLRRFGICSFFSHMMGAILIGPTMLGYSGFLKDLMFSQQSLYILETFHYLGFIFYTFMVGLKMEFRMVEELGRTPVNIGLAVGFAPMIVTYLVAMVYNFFNGEHDFKAAFMIATVSSSESQTSFHTVALFLADLKILNSEIGRLAVATSMISYTCSFSLMMILLTFSEAYTSGPRKGLLVVGSFLCFILFIIFVLKPIMHWMIKQCPPGSATMKDAHVFIVFLMVLLCAGLGEVLGHKSVIGPLILGLCVPPGPPLAETVEDRLESMVSLVLMPLFYVANCGKLVTRSASLRTVLAVVSIIVLAFATKVTAAILPSMYSGVSLSDSLVLGLILASQGVTDLIIFGGGLAHNLISPEVYTIMIYCAVAVAGMTSILVKTIYKPSMDYSAYTRRSLGDIMPNTRFQILTCIYRDINVPGIINLLEASNAMDESPITLYLLHLIELKRVAPPFLIAHKRQDDNSIYYNRSEHIINAFRLFEQHNNKKVLLNSFSSLSPCVTMHQDICSLAVDKRVSLIILPFHRQFNLDGTMEAKTTLRNVNCSVLKFSPCSVGILIDRRSMPTNNLSSRGKPLFHIAIIFLGGADDREVLTYGMRMVEDPNTRLTVLRFSLLGEKKSNLRKDKKLDVELLDDFRHKYVGKGGINYREEVMSDVFGILNALREIKNKFDLIMVGRQHRQESELFEGVSEWNEFPELGFMGDFFATSNLQEDASILVMQQKYQIPEDLVHQRNYRIHV
ncbi:hypothetical protein ACHQM5_022013 [Ranunculus cassubicifolius]